MEQTYQSVFRWNSLNLYLRFAVRCYSSVNIDWHVPYDGDVAVYIVHHSLWLMLVPFLCNLDIMIFTDVPMEICCNIIVSGDVLFFLLIIIIIIIIIIILLLLLLLLLSFLSILLLPSLLFFIFYFLFVFSLYFFMALQMPNRWKESKKEQSSVDGQTHGTSSCSSSGIECKWLCMKIWILSSPHQYFF